MLFRDTHTHSEALLREVASYLKGASGVPEKQVLVTVEKLYGRALRDELEYIYKKLYLIYCIESSNSGDGVVQYSYTKWRAIQK